MAETESPDINCVYVDTNLETHLLIPVDNNETVSDFKGENRTPLTLDTRTHSKSLHTPSNLNLMMWVLHVEKLCKEHRHCFPKLGEINISAVKVTRLCSVVFIKECVLV